MPANRPEDNARDDDLFFSGRASEISRRGFLERAGLLAAGLMVSPPAPASDGGGKGVDSLIPADKKLDPSWVRSLRDRGTPTVSRGATELAHIAMPIGGICSGQLYMGGDGKLWHWDIFNLPQAQNFIDCNGSDYAKPPKPGSPIEQGFAVRVKSGGSVATRRLDASGFNPDHIGFRGQYPMAFVAYEDPGFPVTVSLEAFSPFIPLNATDSASPATVMHYTVKNITDGPVEVELGGWLENGVCLGSAQPGMGTRKFRVIREQGQAILHGTLEPTPEDRAASKRDDILFEDFEAGYGRWTVEGEAFGKEPAEGTLDNQQPVTGFEGKRLVNSYRGGDVPTGKMTSEPFKIGRKFIAFLIGGGGSPGRTCVNLLVDGKVVRTAAGRDVERLRWAHWGVVEFEGREARLEIVDAYDGGWGHVNVDQIVFTDSPSHGETRLDRQEDYGSMALAILGGPDGTFAFARLPGDSPESVFDRADAGGEADASAPIGKKLVGGLGRRLTLAPGDSAEATFLVTWFFPGLMRDSIGPLHGIETLRRSYATRFGSAAEVARELSTRFDELAGATRLWNRTWYDSTLPHWLLDRAFFPITTLATSTAYRFDNGRFYAFEGVMSCQGTCQHVWNYAQSVGRIFPELERDLRVRTDFGTAWHESGATDYRGECARHVAHDGQCGVILRAYREHLTSPDDAYLKATWPRIKKSIEYLINCDGGTDGILKGEQFNTLDAAWFGPMAWISSLYIGALRAGEAMARDVKDDAFAGRCRAIAERGSDGLVRTLYNGEYFIHRPDPSHPDATNTNDGCHIDQLMGQAWAFQVGLPRIVPREQATSALRSIWKYNFAPDAGGYMDRMQGVIKKGRIYAMPGEAGVVMTTFPRGGAEKATGKGGFAYYFNEVWTGQEHQLAAHMMWEGLIDEALVITRTVHDRHHASRRSPYNEVECGDHYSRGMASYGTFLAACGFDYHGPRGHLSFAPRISPDDFRAPFTAAEGWGTYRQKVENGTQTAGIEVRRGKLKLRSLAFESRPGRRGTDVRVSLGGKPLRSNSALRGNTLNIELEDEAVIETGQTLQVQWA